MAGLDSGLSDESGSGLNNLLDLPKTKDNIPSSYFLTEFSISKKSSDNQHKGSGRYCNDEPSTSGRKVSVNISAHRADKKTEVAFTSNFSSKKKVDSWTQSDRNIVGQEESPPKERKKWVRPPVVGQAANIDLPPVSSINQQTSSDSELEKKKSPKFHLSLEKTTSYFDTCTQKVSYDKADFNKDEIPATPENIDFHRVPSPASISSLTSRPLEWDSGADVGYNNVFCSTANDQRLSTIEKLALVQGTSNIFKRSDPEGTTGNNTVIPNPITVKIPGPVAESTPKNIDQHRSDSDSDYPRISKSNKEKNSHPLFPEVVVKTVGIVSDGSTSPDIPRPLKSNKPKEQESENLKKFSASLEEMGAKNTEEKVEQFPRSHSQNNILEENNIKGAAQRIIDSAKSRSSSSVSTVVNKRGCDVYNPIYSKSSYESPPNRDSDENQNNFDNHLVQNQQDDNPSRHTSPQGTDQFNTLESGPLMSEARVNSFEYLPGHVYENSVAIVNSDSSSQQSNIVWNTSGKNATLKEDVERGANLMAEFIRSSKAGEDDALKKQLVRRVVEKLINTEYRDDDSIKSARSIGRNSNMMMGCRGQISGESSTEKSDANQTEQQLPNKANKCVGTGISTSLSGYTETSEWNSATESSRKSTSDCLDSHSSIGAHGKVDKVTQMSVRAEGQSKHYQADSRDCGKSKGVKNKKKGTEEEMLMYLQKERKNQLQWIKSEIDHLSNLKKLLEKHELLKKNLDHLKRNHQVMHKPLKSYSELLDKQRKSKYKRDQKEFKSASCFSTVGGNTGIDFKLSKKDCGWTSHHYETEDDLRIRKENIEPKITSLKKKPSVSISDPLPRSTSYTIIFPSKSDTNIKRKMSEDSDILLSVGELKTAIDEIVQRHRKPTPVPTINQPSLKECLKSVRPDYVRKAETRRQILSEIGELRQQRQSNKQEIIAAAHADIPGPPPPLAVKRVFNQKSLRKQTERKYRQLAEVRNKKADLKRKEEYRTNRLMAEIFNKKLQKRTLQGQVNLSNSVCVTDPSK